MFQLPKLRIKARFAPKNCRLEPGPLKFHSLGDVNALLVCVQTYVSRFSDYILHSKIQGSSQQEVWVGVDGGLGPVKDFITTIQGITASCEGLKDISLFSSEF